MWDSSHSKWVFRSPKGLHLKAEVRNRWSAMIQLKRAAQLDKQLEQYCSSTSGGISAAVQLTKIGRWGAGCIKMRNGLCSDFKWYTCTGDFATLFTWRNPDWDGIPTSVPTIPPFVSSHDIQPLHSTIPNVKRMAMVLFLAIIHGIADLISMLFRHSDVIQQPDWGIGNSAPETYGLC